MAPAGRSRVGLEGAICDDVHGANTAAASASTARTAAFLGDMHFHLVDCVVEIAAGIPHASSRLGTALAIGGPRADREIAGLGNPFVMPQPPRVASSLFTEIRQSPRCPAVDGNL